MSAKWIGTKFKGVRYYEHPTRKHGVKKDRYLAIRYQKDGKRIEEGIGWTSERDPEDDQNWTEAKAALVLERLRGAAKHGKNEAPTRLIEKREIETRRKEVEKRARELAEKENITFGYFFESVYFPTFKIGRKKDTVRKGKEHFKNWINPVIGPILFKDLKPFHLEKIKKNVLAAGMTPRSLQYVFATLRQIWNMAKRDGLITGDSPTKQVSIPKIDNKRIRFLSHEEAETLLGALQAIDPLTHDLALLSLHTGLRMGEMASLKWSHIDLNREIIHVMDPKGGEGRVAFMTEKVRSMFNSLQRRQADDYVFTKKDGQRLNEMPRIFFEVVKELGFNEGVTDPRQKVVAHSLRHTFASWHVEAGTDLYTVKSLLGHSVIAMT
ncbi:MAG TPA: site-specific integrase, partial [Thermodesulfobacteriota bacterium]|nr:site-specific integrase [Thermodesulfobacteriota bacterium]